MKFKVLFLLGFVVLLTGCSFNLGTNKFSMLRIPDVSGMALEDAVSILELNGFDYNKVEYLILNEVEIVGVSGKATALEGMKMV